METQNDTKRDEHRTWWSDCPQHLQETLACVIVRCSVDMLDVDEEVNIAHMIEGELMESSIHSIKWVGKFIEYEKRC